MHYTADLSERFVQVARLTKIAEAASRIKDELLSNHTPISGPVIEVECLQRDVTELNSSATSAYINGVIKAHCRKAMGSEDGTRHMDFNDLLGDFIKERMESLIFDSFQIGRILKIEIDFRDSCQDGDLWICGSPEIMTIFEILKHFNPCIYMDVNVKDDDLVYVGSYFQLESNWHLIKGNKIPINEFYVGYRDDCVKIRVINFVV